MVEPKYYGSHRRLRLVAIGASAGGVSAISELVGALPADLDAAVLVVLHLSPTAHSALPSIIARRTRLRVLAAVDGAPVEPRTVYVAPPDFHLAVADGVLRVERGPWENGHRPSIDTLFRSVADDAGARAVAVVLSGALDDGAAGLVAVHRAGGVALVQDPHEATVPDMPLAALATGVTDERLTLKELAVRIADLCSGVVADGVPSSTRDANADEPSSFTEGAQPSGFVCPDCGGALYDLENDVLHFRCRVGHAWSPETLHASLYRRFEEGLWTALRVLEEDVALQERIAKRAREHGRRVAAARIERRLEERAQLLESLRQIVADRPAEPDAAGENT